MRSTFEPSNGSEHRVRETIWSMTTTTRSRSSQARTTASTIVAGVLLGMLSPPLLPEALARTPAFDGSMALRSIVSASLAQSPAPTPAQPPALPASPPASVQVPPPASPPATPGHAPPAPAPAPGYAPPSGYAPPASAPTPGYAPPPPGYAPAPASPAQGYPPPQPAATPVNPELERLARQRRIGRRFMISGWTLLGATFLTSALIGAVAIDSASDPVQRQFGYRMLIPVGGPFAAAAATRSATAALFSSVAGAAQITGLALGITGAVLYAKARQRERSWNVAIVPSRSATHLLVMWRF